MRFIYFLFFIFFSCNLFSQVEKYSVEIYTNVDDIAVLVNDSVIFNGSNFQLPAGEYKIKIWSSGYKIKNDTIVVKAIPRNIYQFGMFPADEVVENSKAINHYLKVKATNYTLSSTLVVAGVTLVGIFHSKMNKSAKSYNIYYDSYSGLVSNASIINTKSEMAELEEQYKTNRLYTVLGYSLLGAGLGYMTFAILKDCKTQKPKKYIPPQNSPWEGKFMIGFNSTGLGIKFKF